MKFRRRKLLCINLWSSGGGIFVYILLWQHNVNIFAKMAGEIPKAPSSVPPTNQRAHYPNPPELGENWKRVQFPNPPDSHNPDPSTLREQWKFAIRQYSRWYSQAWGTAILAGVSFFALGWFIKGSNPLPSLSTSKSNESKKNDDKETQPNSWLLIIQKCVYAQMKPSAECWVCEDVLERSHLFCFLHPVVERSFIWFFSCN